MMGCFNVRIAKQYDECALKQNFVSLAFLRFISHSLCIGWRDYYKILSKSILHTNTEKKKKNCYFLVCVDRLTLHLFITHSLPNISQFCHEQHKNSKDVSSFPYSPSAFTSVER
ncbi:unnamed protein product [Pipistrellus nathusii]|uniref:Uncharacterized protein n=1 Tax=Pipistrellus nathusii TaxID=59473 RepID=A0ABN9Z718_PIPNA